MPPARVHTPSPMELWNSAPWYEQFGMIVYLGAHVYLLIRIFIG